MAEDGRIVYKIVVDDSGAIVDAERSGEKIKDKLSRGASGGALEKIMTGVAHRIGAAFVDMAAKAVQGIGDIAKAGVDFNAKMQTYETAFTTLLGSAEEAQKVMAQIRQDAAATPFDVDSLTQANQLLISAGVSAGAARDDVLNLANAIAATGGGSEELSRMAQNLQQIKNVGKATAMDIRQFAMAGINIYGLLADSMGVTAEEAAEMDVTYEQLAEALAHAAEEGGVYAGALQAQSETFVGQISTLKDNAMLLAGSLTEELFTVLAEDALPQVQEWLATLLEAAETGGVEGALAAAGNILTGLIDGLIANLPMMAETGLQVLINLMNGLSNNLPTVVSTVMTIITTLLSTLLSNAPQLLIAGINLLISLVTGMIQSIPQLLAVAVQAVQTIWDTFYNTDWSSVGANIVNGIWAGIQGLWDWAMAQVRSFAQSIWGAVKSELGIASPSKKFRWIGEMSVEGTTEAFEDGETDMVRTVKTIYGEVADSANYALGAGLKTAAEQSISYNVLSNTGGVSEAASITSQLGSIFSSAARPVAANGAPFNVNIAFTGALAELGAVLQPVITVEDNRQGPSLIK